MFYCGTVPSIFCLSKRLGSNVLLWNSTTYIPSVQATRVQCFIVEQYHLYSVYLYIHIYIYTHTYARTHARTHTHTHTRTHTPTHIHTHTHTYIHTYIRTDTHLYSVPHINNQNYFMFNLLNLILILIIKLYIHV